MRKALWEKVASRKHVASKIFPFGPDSNEVMLRGTVQYGLKAGGESGLEWAAYAKLTKVDGGVKMEFYQVYLVSGVHELLGFAMSRCMLMLSGYWSGRSINVDSLKG
jgi:hypothetical protein